MEVILDTPFELNNHGYITDSGTNKLIIYEAKQLRRADCGDEEIELFVLSEFSNVRKLKDITYKITAERYMLSDEKWIVTAYRYDEWDEKIVEYSNVHKAISKFHAIQYAKSIIRNKGFANEQYIFFDEEVDNQSLSTAISLKNLDIEL